MECTKIANYVYLIKCVEQRLFVHAPQKWLILERAIVATCNEPDGADVCTSNVDPNWQSEKIALYVPLNYGYLKPIQGSVI